MVSHHITPSTKPEFRSWRRFHGVEVTDFGLTQRVGGLTSAKLGWRRIRCFPAAVCACADRPRRWTNAGPNGGPRAPAKRRPETPERVAWRAADTGSDGWRAEIPQAN